jgi:hypothetical protein
MIIRFFKILYARNTHELPEEGITEYELYLFTLLNGTGTCSLEKKKVLHNSQNNIIEKKG